MTAEERLTRPQLEAVLAWSTAHRHLTIRALCLEVLELREALSKSVGFRFTTADGEEDIYVDESIEQDADGERTVWAVLPMGESGRRKQFDKQEDALAHARALAAAPTPRCAACGHTEYHCPSSGCNHLDEAADAWCACTRFVAVEAPDESVGGEFTCPTCGSHFFGTENASAPIRADRTGYCNGYIIHVGEGARHCGFRWSRADDGKYFAAPVKR